VASSRTPEGTSAPSFCSAARLNWVCSTEASTVATAAATPNTTITRRNLRIRIALPRCAPHYAAFHGPQERPVAAIS
jgi:hypothetical protein